MSAKKDVVVPEADWPNTPWIGPGFTTGPSWSVCCVVDSLGE